MSGKGPRVRLGLGLKNYIIKTHTYIIKTHTYIVMGGFNLFKAVLTPR